MYRESLGIIGGFGAYATLDFYRNILEAFASECERNYPHIYMDNDFTMPSRTKALLYGDGYDEIVEMIAASMRKLDSLGADHIVMACGTAHYFLPNVFKLVPEVKEKVINIIEVLKDKLLMEKVDHVLVIAAEGTLKQSLYAGYLDGINCTNPSEEYYNEIRYFIEAVKQNNMHTDVGERFLVFLDKFQCRDVVLGCTEFPVLVNLLGESEVGEELAKYRFWDPLVFVIELLKEKMK